MADYRLTQTGQQVQQDLNNAETDHTILDNHVNDGSIHVTPENKQTWNNKYDKPGTGIPSSDFTTAVQNALTAALSAYQKPNDGIPASDLAAAVQTALEKALSAYQKPSGGIPSSDFTTSVQNALTLALSAYQKPNTGIPAEDLSAAVQSALTAATGMQQSIDDERDARVAAVSAEAEARSAADLALSNLIGTKTTQAQVESLIAAALASYTNTAGMNSAIATALAPYSTTAEVNLAISNAITTALANYYTSTVINQMLSEKVNKVDGKQLSTEDFTTALKNKLDALPTSSELATQISTAISDALASYYTKAQTDSLLAQKQTAQQVADAIAAALTSYSTTIQMNTAISNALAAYYTKTQVDGMFGDTNGRVLFLERGLGKYDTTRNITLQQATAGKYVNVNGQEVSASGYGISAEVQLNAGDIMLVPSASAVPADVSLFARIVTRTYDKVITYAYTYRQDYPQLPLTATADYNPALIYTAQYDESGDTPVLTGWLMGGQTYTTLPATREVTESYYEPLMKQAVAAMPSTGYYVYLCPTSMTVVVSGYTATVNGGVAMVVGLGIFKNIATNFIGAPGQAVIAQAFAQLVGEIAGLKAQLDNLGEARAVCINSEDVPKVQNYPMIIYGSGAPTAPNVPAFIGQKYLDTTNKKEYTAFSVTNSISDWVLIN
jgi:hypothetical protein